MIGYDLLSDVNETAPILIIIKNRVLSLRGCRYFRTMSPRKLTASRLFDGTRFLEDRVLILSEDGTVEALLPASDVSDAQTFDGILTPGFINAHCHLELSHM